MPSADPTTAQSELSDTLADEIARLEGAALDFLRALIRTPSVSGNEGIHLDPTTVAGQLWSSLADVGRIDRQADEVAPGRDNVLAVIPGDRERVFVLDAHTDTVPTGDPAGWLD